MSLLDRPITSLLFVQTTKPGFILPIISRLILLTPIKALDIPISLLTALLTALLRETYFVRYNNRKFNFWFIIYCLLRRLRQKVRRHLNDN